MKEYLEQFQKKPEKSFLHLFWNILFFFGPVVFVIGVLSLAGIVPFRMNETDYYGMQGFLAALFYIPVVSFCMTGLYWVFYSIGNFMLRVFIKLL